jgi:hypothetical protein
VADRPRVTLAGMEATGVYWKPVFWVLEDQVECWLLNAKHLQACPGPKDRRVRFGVDLSAGRARAGASVVRATQADPGAA